MSSALSSQIPEEIERGKTILIKYLINHSQQGLVPNPTREKNTHTLKRICTHPHILWMLFDIKLCLTAKNNVFIS